MNVQVDPVHLLVKVPPRISISGLMGVLKGRTAIRLFNVLPSLRKKPYWGNHFWAKGDCVDTVGLNSEMIQKYVRFQEKEEQDQQQLQLGPEPGGPSKKGREVCPPLGGIEQNRVLRTRFVYLPFSLTHYPVRWA